MGSPSQRLARRLPLHASTSGPLFGLKVFAFFGDVAPKAGGTLIIARSHQIVTRFLEREDDDVHADFRRTRLRFMNHHAWLRDLANPNYDTGRTTRFMEQDSDLDGIAARVVELTGDAGDVVVTHPWTVHHIALNAGHFHG